MGTAVFILETVVIILSFLAGLGALGGPVIVRIALAFCALFIIPGHSLSALVFRSKASIPEAACRIFSMGLIFASVVVCAGFVPGVSYRAISIVASALAIALAFLARAPRRIAQDDPEPRRPGEALGPSRSYRRKTALVGGVLFAVCVAAFSGTGELGWSTDSLDHVSFVSRSVESGVLFPRDSYYRDGDGISVDPRKGLWHPVLSLWTYQTHAPAYRVWRDAPAFLSFFAVCSFLFFAIQFCGSRRCAALFLAFFLLFYGGEGIAWLTKVGFSRNIAQIALWIDLAFLFVYYRTGKRAYLLAGALLACVGTAFHVVFAMLLGVSLAGVFFYVTLLRGGAAWRGAFWRSIPFQLAGMAIPLAIRAPGAFVVSNAIHTHMQGMLVFSPNLAIVDPAELLMRYGPVFFFALLAAPFFPLVAERAGRRGLAFMLFVVPVILVLDPLIASALERRIGYLHYRILDAAPLVVILALVVGGLAERLVMGGAIVRGRGERPRSLLSGRSWANRILAAALLALFIAYPFRLALPRAARSVRALVEKPSSISPSYASLLAALEEKIPDHSVIASDPVTSYVLSAYTDYFVTVILDQHCSPADTSAIERLREARNLLSPAVALSASRTWIDRSGADYVLINADLPERTDFFNSFLPGEASRTREKFMECPSLFASALDLDGFHMFMVRRDSPGSPAEEACGVARMAAVSCPASGDSSGDGGIGVDAGTDVGGGISLMNLTVDNYLLRSGDTLAGHFCWKALRKESFGLPFDVIVRIDAAFPRGALYRDWYGKQYRRIVERRGGGFYRFTWRTRLMSGPAYPDMWEEGRSMRQEFALPLPASMAPGPYEVRVKVIRAPYLENRRVADYLSNDDSLQGVPVGMIYLREESENGNSGREDARPSAHRAG
jgi:hypothetical protein